MYQLEKSKHSATPNEWGVCEGGTHVSSFYPIGVYADTIEKLVAYAIAEACGEFGSIVSQTFGEFNNGEGDTFTDVLYLVIKWTPNGVRTFKGKAEYRITEGSPVIL